MAKRSKAAKDLMVVEGTGQVGSKTRLTALAIDRVEALARSGLQQLSIAAILGIHAKTWRDVRDSQPEVGHAFQRGRAYLEEELAGLLVAQARKGNIPAIIFSLKNVANWSDGGIRGEAAPSLQVNINIPPAMSKDEFQEIVDGKTIEHKPKGRSTR